MLPKKFRHSLSLLALALGMSSAAMAGNKIPVVASFSILGDLVSEVGGNHIDLTTLVKANGDPHVYSPAPMDAKAVKNAKLLVVNGLEFEGWIPRVLESANFSGEKIVASNGIETIKGGDADHGNKADDHDQASETPQVDEHHHGGFDPHAWNSIINAKIYVRNIERGLSKVDPENSRDYEKNALVYLHKLDQLEVKLQTEMNTIPLSQRKIITPHDAFAYFSRDFNIIFIAPQGTSTEAEASAGDVAAIIKQIRKDKIGAVFMENIADNRMIEQISRETSAKIGGKLFTGALSGAQGPAATYLKMMQYNVDTIVNALSH